jgi:hypothetical protein
MTHTASRRFLTASIEETPMFSPLIRLRAVQGTGWWLR